MIAGMVSKKTSRPWAKTTRCRLAFVICLFSAASLSLGGEKLAEFMEPFDYPTFAIDEERVYVWDSKSVIHIYDREKFTHLGQFGRKGQGPPDFEYIGYVNILPDRLCIGQGQKISYFSKTGEFIKCLTNPNPTTGSYVPMGSNFVGTRYQPDDPKNKLTTLAYSLYDSKFEPIKQIYQAEVPKATVYNYEKGKRDVLLVRGCYKYEVHDNRLYVGDTTQGFFFRVFDHRGDLLYEIRRNYEKREISSGEVKKMMAEFREALGAQEFERRKNLVNQYIFPEFFPAFSDFAVADGMLYVFSYPIPDRLRVVTILDLHGNLLREVEIAGVRLQHAFESAYRVYKNRYYYMVYNEESDKWELHVESLE